MTFMNLIQRLCWLFHTQTMEAVFCCMTASKISVQYTTVPFSFEKTAKFSSQKQVKTSKKQNRISCVFSLAKHTMHANRLKQKSCGQQVRGWTLTVQYEF